MVQSALTSVNISVEILVSFCDTRKVSISYVSGRGILKHNKDGI